MDIEQWLSAPRSRRSAMRQLGVLAGVGLTGGLGVSAIKRAMAAEVNPISHVLIASQENRTFDTYFGRYPQAGHFGFPSNYALPDGAGGTVKPHLVHSPMTRDISHSWQDIHKEWHNGAMDGFYTTDGSSALGYYDASNLSYYWQLANAFTLCGNYFCSLLGP